MPRDGSRRRPARFPAIAVVAAALTLILAPRALLAGLSSPPPLLPRRGAPQGPRAEAAAVPDPVPAAAAAHGLLEDLVNLAASSSEQELNARVDADFGKLTPDDLNALQGRLETADVGSRPQLELLTRSIQASMEKRMEQAKLDIDSLLMSSGDIDDNIRRCLERQDSPLPIMAVLQMNIGKARRDGLQKQEQALVFIFSKINAELERKVPVANRVLTRMLSIGESAERREFLRGHLSQQGADEAGPEALAGAIVQLVADVERRFADGGAGFGGESREGTLELLRQVALDAGVVVGEVSGEEAQGVFSEQLGPLFEALSK